MLHDTFLRIFGRRLFAPETEGAGEPEPDDTADDAADDADDTTDDAADDADDTADDAADDADDTADDVDDAPSARRENRVSRLANEAREERDRRIALEAENRVLRESGPKQGNEDARRLREEKLSLMEPAERKAFLQDEELGELRRGQQLMQIQMADTNDRSSYDTKALANPIYAKHKDWVENTLRAERAAGRNPSREALIRIKIGDDALKPRSKKQSAAQKDAAAERVRKAKGQTLSARGDGAGSSKKGDASLEAMRQRLLDREARGDM